MNIIVLVRIHDTVLEENIGTADFKNTGLQIYLCRTFWFTQKLNQHDSAKPMDGIVGKLAGKNRPMSFVLNIVTV